MLLALVAIFLGLALLVWSADRLVDGATALARHFSVAPLLVGLLIVGFGSSAPELMVSTLAAWQGYPALALGNAWGSSLVNIGVVLAITAIISPIAVHSVVLRKELPLLTGATLLSVALAWDGELSRLDSLLLLALFALLLAWSVSQGRTHRNDALAQEAAAGLEAAAMPLPRALAWVALGLFVLVAASQALVWGAVAVAQSLGMSELVMGLTVVAAGTTLPELAACMAAARKGEHDMALGHVLGANLFNMLAVVGVAGAIAPLEVAPEALTRDLLTLSALTVALFAMGYGWRGAVGRINRWEACALLLAYAGYLAWLLRDATRALA